MELYRISMFLSAANTAYIPVRDRERFLKKVQGRRLICECVKCVLGALIGDMKSLVRSFSSRRRSGNKGRLCGSNSSLKRRCFGSNRTRQRSG